MIHRLKFRKREPLLALTKAPPANRQAYCDKCGKPGAMRCGACAAAYRMWVEKNTAMRGGNEGANRE